MSLNQQQLDSVPVLPIKNNAPGLAAFSNIIEQHAIDAAFLWLLRSFSESSTFYVGEDIIELDQRIIGHLEGLISAGQLGWDISLQNFEYKEPGETFVAAAIAFQSGDADKINIVCEKALANPEMTPGLVSALGWLHASKAEILIKRFLNSNSPKYLYLGIAACSIRRLDPEQELNHILQIPNISQQPKLYARSLRLIGEIKRHDLESVLNQALDAKHKSVRFWANWSAILLGNLAAINQIKPYVMEDSPHRDQALELLFNVLPVDEARQLISDMSEDSSQIPTVIKSLAVLGDPYAIPRLIQQMNQLLYARQAGLSFSLITGIDLEQDKLDKEFEIEFKDDLEGNIEDDAENSDNGLPWPDQNKVQAFWDDHRKSLDAGQRYFMGQPIAGDSLRHILQSGNQMQRSAAALKLSVLELNTELQDFSAPTITI